MKNLVLIGATGKVGRQVAELLLGTDTHLTLVARGAERLEPFRQRGATVAALSVTETARLTELLCGADAVLTMIASNPLAEDFLADQRAQARSQAAAIQASGIRYVVNLSSVGCHVKEGNGVIQGLSELEVLLDAIPDLNVLHVRPSFYMENILYALELIRHQGIYGMSIRPEVAFPLIATRDVAAYIVQRLQALDFSGSSIQPLLGPQDYTLPQLAEAVGQSIGRDVPYIPFSVEDFVAGIRQSGATPDYANRFAELMVATDRGLLNYHPRTLQNTTPTTLKTFAETVFAPAYSA